MIPMGRKSFAIVLFFGMLALSASVYCQSLCIGGHGAHSSHISKSRHSTAMHSEAGHCNLSHSKQDAKDSCPHTGQTSLRCDCSGELTVVSGYHILGSLPSQPRPYLQAVYMIQTTGTIYAGNDVPPTEGPPKIA